MALVESNVVGGTCVNVGRIPSKAMLAPAEAYFRAGHHPVAGIHTAAVGADLGAMLDARAELVDRLRAETCVDLARTTGSRSAPAGPRSSTAKRSPAARLRAALS